MFGEYLDCISLVYDSLPEPFDLLRGVLIGDLFKIFGARIIADESRKRMFFDLFETHKELRDDVVGLLMKGLVRG